MKVNGKDTTSSELKGQEAGEWTGWLLKGVQPLVLEITKALGPPASSLLGKAITFMEQKAESEPILCTLGSTEGGKQLVYTGSNLSHCY